MESVSRTAITPLSRRKSASSESSEFIITVALCSLVKSTSLKESLFTGQTERCGMFHLNLDSFFCCKNLDMLHRIGRISFQRSNGSHLCCRNKISPQSPHILWECLLFFKRVFKDNLIILKRKLNISYYLTSVYESNEENIVFSS